MNNNLPVPTSRGFLSEGRRRPEGQSLSPAARMSFMDRDAAAFTWMALQNISALSSLADKLSETTPSGEEYYRQVMNKYVETVVRKYGGL